METIISFAFYLTILYLLISVPKRKRQTGSSKAPVLSDSKDYANAYQKVSLLTDREQKEYQKLKQYADMHHVLICPKVRLLDLISPKPGSRNYRTLLHKVMSKHVDFVICSQDMQVLGIIELDDTTHLRKDRKERDEFVDSVLQGCGYKILHVWEINSDTLDNLLNEVTITKVQIQSPTGWTWNEHTKLWEPPADLK